MKNLLSPLIMMLLPILTSAQEPVIIDGLKYDLNVDEKTASVSGENYYNGILVIPEKVNYKDVDYTVTSISGNAFIRNYDLLSVTIPNTIKSIGGSTFWDCTSLSSVKIGDGVETIGSYAFYSCALVSISIGKNVSSIGVNAFSGNSNLNQVYINDLKKWCQIDFESLEANPLYYAHHLYLNKKEVKELVIPEEITMIKDYAFAGGSSIKSLTIGDNVNSIGAYSFYQCSSLASVEFASSITSINNYAFYECTELEAIQLPDGIESLGESCFYGCSKLEELKLPGNLKQIKYSAFKNCNKIRSVTIPSSVEFIYQNAFSFTSSESVDFFVNPEYPPMAYGNSFPEGSKLYVPDGSIEPYQNVEPWSSFDIHTFSGSGPEKCTTPVVSYKNGVLSFSSETPDAEFHYVITSSDGQKNVGNSLNISGNCVVSVYASKKGYEDSETVTSEINIIGKLGDVNRDGEVNVADHVKLTEIIMEQNNAGDKE